jgi:hypothetical protein
MTFEEQLTKAFDTLTERLRGEIDQHVRRVSAELTAAAPYDRDPDVLAVARQELDDAVSSARQASREQGLAAGREAGLAIGREAGLAAGRDAGFAAGREEGFAAGREAGIAAGREEGLALGHDAGRTEAQRETAVVHASHRAEFDRFADAFRAMDAAQSLTEILDTLIAVASLDVSDVDVWLVRGGRLHRWQPGGHDNGNAAAERPLDASEPLAQAATSNSTVRSDELLAIPIALAGQVVAVFSVKRNSRPGAVESPGIEPIVRYAARSLEAVTAFRTARALTEGPETVMAELPAQTADGAIAEEETSARRYARLLVSEIKLYHEAAVVEGRRDRDLATRLGGEIARARVMYEQRVPPHVRARSEYFHEELVKTLANGDASLLEMRT